MCHCAFHVLRSISVVISVSKEAGPTRPCHARIHLSQPEAMFQAHELVERPATPPDASEPSTTVGREEERLPADVVRASLLGAHLNHTHTESFLRACTVHTRPSTLYLWC